MIRGILILLIAILFSACYKDSDELWLEERELIRNYLSSQGISAYQEDSTSGYFYYFLNASNTAEDSPTIVESVEVHFTASLLDGTTLYSTYSDSMPDIIELREALYGWQLALPKFHVGDEGVLILPSRLAYAEDGLDGLVPPNSIIRFDIQLIQVHPHF